MSERRGHARLARPLEGSWRGASGATRCRISDISVGGCFVQSLAMPSTGERTEIVIEVDAGQPMQVAGAVVYAERGMGFAVKFVDLEPDALAALEALVASLAPPANGS